MGEKLVELEAARTAYGQALKRALESLDRQEDEYRELCEHLDAARRELRFYVGREGEPVGG